MSSRAFLIFLTFSSFFLYSCKKEIVSPSLTKEATFTVKEVDFDFLVVKTKVKYQEGKKTINGDVNFRIRKDSVIWASVSPSVGIEVTRALFLEDSVIIMNRLAKEYYVYSFEEFSKKLNFEVDFTLLQNILLGNMPIAKHKEFNVEKNRDFVKVEEQNGDLLIDSYINPDIQKLQSVFVRQKDTDNTLSLKYEEFKNLNEYLFPYHCMVNLTYQSDNGQLITSVNLKHHKVEISDKPLRFPFNIPSKYELR